MNVTRKPQFPLVYHPLHFLLLFTTSSTCHMDLRHYRRAQRKAKEAILRSMKWRQVTSVMTPPALPSSDELWCSLRLQLMEELQRLAWEWRMTLLEEREFVLTQTTGLTMQERCWLEQTWKLVLIMPPPAR